MCASPFSTICLDDGSAPKHLVNDLETQIDSMVQQLGGYPVFLRCGGTSAKHSWKDSCFLPSREKILSHVYEIMSYAECASGPSLDYDTFAVRELIPTTPAFFAFHGDMPITREFRFFVKNIEVPPQKEPASLGGGKFIPHLPDRVPTITHAQAYWPADAFEREAEGWKEPLATMNAIALGEFCQLAEIAKQSIKHFYDTDGWSVDLLQDSSGEWWVTDMATASSSWKHEALPVFEDYLKQVSA